MSECIEDVGIIKDIVNGMLQVSIPSSSRCRACGVCSSAQGKEMLLTVYNRGDFAIGDRVKIKIEGRNLLFASFVVYIVPLLDMFISFFIGWYLTNKFGNPEYAQLVGAIAGGVGFALSFYFSRMLNNKMEREESHFIQISKEAGASANGLRHL